MHLRGDVIVGVAGQEAAKLGGELSLAAAAPAQAEVLLDHGALGLAGDAVEVLPQLADRLCATNHLTGSLSSPCVSAYSHRRFSNSFRPRCNCASTVPSGRSSIRATSLVAQPSM